jgi:hypothetical protein
MTRFLSLTLIGLVAGACLVLSCFHIGVRMASADAPALLDAGSGSSSATAAPADQLHNPVQSPVLAFDDVAAAKKLGWAAMLFAILVMATKALAYAKDHLEGVPLVGKLAAWLSVTKRAMYVSGIGAGATAAYNAIALGGTWMAAVFVGGGLFLALTHPFGTPAPTPAPASS